MCQAYNPELETKMIESWKDLMNQRGKMKADIKERWLERLESGEISQARGTLGRPIGSRCCLGVLCDIAVEDGIIPAPIISHTQSDAGKVVKIFAYGKEGATGNLPFEVIEWAGLAEEDPEYTGRDGNSHSLAGLNDSAKYNFKKIAAVVRKHF